MRGEQYTGKVDVYSFGAVLLAMGVEGTLGEFFAEQWRQDFANGKPLDNGTAATRALCDIWKGQWRPNLAVGESLLPSGIVALIGRCCAHDPAQRPLFSEVLAELTGPCSAEIEAGSFFRGGHNSTRSGDGRRRPPLGKESDGTSPPWAQQDGVASDLEKRKTENLLRQSGVFRAAAMSEPTAAARGGDAALSKRTSRTGLADV